MVFSCLFVCEASSLVGFVVLVLNSKFFLPIQV